MYITAIKNEFKQPNTNKHKIQEIYNEFLIYIKNMKCKINKDIEIHNFANIIIPEIYNKFKDYDYLRTIIQELNNQISNKKIIKNVLFFNNLYYKTKLINIINENFELSDMDILKIISVFHILKQFGNNIHPSFYDKCCNVLISANHMVCNYIMIYLLYYKDLKHENNNIYQNYKLLQIIIDNINFDKFIFKMFWHDQVRSIYKVSVFDVFNKKYLSMNNNNNYFYEKILVMLYNRAKKINDQEAIYKLNNLAFNKDMEYY